MAGHEVELTPTEHELLRILSVNAGQVTTSDLLLRQFWVRREDANVQAVRNFVKKLRPSSATIPPLPPSSSTLCGVGYRMPKPGEE